MKCGAHRREIHNSDIHKLQTHKTFHTKFIMFFDVSEL